MAQMLEATEDRALLGQGRCLERINAKRRCVLLKSA